MPGDPVAAVVLAAGLSSRMGENKMLIEVGGRTLVRRAVETALSAGLDPVLAVVGHESDRIAAELRGLSCTLVPNQEYAWGDEYLAARRHPRPGRKGRRGHRAARRHAADRSANGVRRRRRIRSLFPAVGGLDLWRRARASHPLRAPPLFCRAARPGRRRLRQADREAAQGRSDRARLALRGAHDLDEPADLERVRARLEAA